MSHVAKAHPKPLISPARLEPFSRSHDIEHRFGYFLSKDHIHSSPLVSMFSFLNKNNVKENKIYRKSLPYQAFLHFLLCLQYLPSIRLFHLRDPGSCTLDVESKLRCWIGQVSYQIEHFRNTKSVSLWLIKVEEAGYFWPQGGLTTVFLKQLRVLRNPLWRLLFFGRAVRQHREKAETPLRSGL